MMMDCQNMNKKCFIFHKYIKINENGKWKLYKCKRCGNVKYVEKFAGGYQPLPVDLHDKDDGLDEYE